jgi:tetratricopeptide (TPR) repeat protein
MVLLGTLSPVHAHHQTDAGPNAQRFAQAAPQGTAPAQEPAAAAGTESDATPAAGTDAPASRGPATNAVGQSGGPSPSAESAVKPRSSKARVAAARSSETLAAQRVFQILAAEIAAQRGQIGTAAATWLAVARETRDPKAAQRATELALTDRSGGRAIEAAEFWLELEPEAPMPAIALETLWLSNGQLQRAEPLITRQLAVARKNEQLAERYGPLTRNLLRAPDRTAAMALLDRVSVIDLDEPAARIARATLAHAAGNQGRASAEIRSAAALRPGSEEVALTAATVLPVDASGRQEAIALLKSFVDARPKAPRARFALARLYSIDGHLDAALDQLNRTLADEPEDPSTLFAAAHLAAELKRPGEAEQLMRRWVELPGEAGPERNPGRMFLARMAEDQGQPEQSLRWLEQINEGEEQLEALVHRAIVLGRMKRSEDGRTLLLGAIPQTPRDRVRIVQATAELLREDGRPAEAFDVVDAGLAAQPDEPQLLYDRAMLGERLGRLDRMESDLRRLIVLRPNHAHAYNALGYTFAERNIRLDEARTLIERAVQLAPEDPQILDSMGWVAFRQGKAEEALTWLQRAWAIRADAEVGAHLGEVLWRLGRAEEAYTVWRQAIGRDPSNALLRETRDRLGASL